jgi:hypothetical protein
VDPFYSIKIKQNKLEELHRQCLHLNVFPMEISAYLHSTDKSNPVSRLSKELADEILEQISSMETYEYERFVNSFPNAYKFLVERPDSQVKLDKERIAMYYLTARLWLIKLDLKKIINTSFEESEVGNIYPELSDYFDDDNLLKIDDNFILLDEGIQYKKHIIYYSQFLRRGFGGNQNFTFFYELLKYYSGSKNLIDFKIAIDFNRIMPKEYYHQKFEFDTWYGVPFDINKIDDPNETGVTIVGRREGSHFYLNNKLERTEFLWSYKDKIKTLQIEEINNLEGKIYNYYINRYIHSQRDIGEKKFIHLDGAVKIYLENEYKNRYLTEINKSEKAYKKIKLFRIDRKDKNEIELEKWINLISYFFKSNEMIIEYFNPEEYINLFSFEAEG